MSLLKKLLAISLCLIFFSTLAMNIIFFFLGLKITKKHCNNEIKIINLTINTEANMADFRGIIQFHLLITP